MIYAELTGNYKNMKIKNFMDNTLGNWELHLLASTDSRLFKIARSLQ